VEYAGGAMILVALALLVASGLGNRWFTAGRGTARLTAITTLGSAASINLIGLAMVVLSSGTEPTPWLMFLVFIIVPFGVTGTQARRTLALC